MPPSQRMPPSKMSALHPAAPDAPGSPGVRLEDSEVQALGEPGWFTRERFLGLGPARQAAEAAGHLLREGAFRPAGVGQGAARHARAEVRNDALVWLLPEEPRPALRALWAAFEGLRQALNRDAWLGLAGFELQLAHYPPTGARYVRHRDTFRGDPARRITAIVYLNPRWQPEDGGALALYTQPPATVTPTLDRLVIFRSDTVEHAVHPTFADRFAATAWFHGG